ncbi:hypothetical protein TRVA0_010S02344 [Trichomonascus vanleenenianus]|uniref:uncharacterized protein n=1 Tax=Trichomonascus vanleenenianus TaxID=2268995 RepID=UPI003ECB7A7B
MKTFADLPKYDELKDKRRYWEWGAPGSYEEGLGKLNLLTDEHVAKIAAQEIKTGIRVGLGWEMDKMEIPTFWREPFEHEVRTVHPTCRIAFDDVYHFNPQQSSQWDGFRHHGRPKNQPDLSPDDINKVCETEDPDNVIEFYGGTKPSEILDRKSDRIGIHHWAKKGIVGRGVLIDYADWAEKKGIKFSAFTGQVIRLEELQQIIKDYNIELQPGDILFVRVGLINEWNNKDAEWKKKYPNKKVEHSGVEQSEDMLRFLWDNHFVAVAGDSVGFEVTPAVDGSRALHYYLLAGWGVPIGEMFDLDELAATCKRLNRYSFFLSSVPLNSVGGVSSPPNAVAIF